MKKGGFRYSEFFCYTFAQKTNSKTFEKTVKLFLSNKIVSGEQITFIENDRIIWKTVIMVSLSIFFLSSIVTNLKIPEYTKNNSLSLKIL